jgi:DNA-binding NarL/FixJ family response regulator
VLGTALSVAIGAQPDLEIVGVATTIADALEATKTTSPDVVLMDVCLPDGDGIDATAQIRAAGSAGRVLILTALNDPEVLARAAVAGASGFLSKDSPLQDVVAAIRSAGEPDSKMLVESATLRALVGRLGNQHLSSPPRPSRDYGLTTREQDVLRLMGRGLDPKAIAQELFLSLHTCRGYVKSLLAKLDAHSQLEAVVLGIRDGLIPAPSRDDLG